MMTPEFDVSKLKFDERGLIPAVVQDAVSGRVLTLAYMNEESLRISLEKELTCFYSRSRNELWLKGETSGNYQHIVSITADCDYDALTVLVEKDGPACHTGTDSCFTNPVFQSENRAEFSMDGLYALLQGRKAEMPEGSYTTYLFQKGLDKILKKVGVSDVYSDGNSKSITVRLLFGDDERTLTHEEVQAVVDELIEKLKNKGINLKG